METYQFYLNLTNQGKPNKAFSRIVTCTDPTEDGLIKFIDEVTKDGRFLPIEDDIHYQLL